MYDCIYGMRLMVWGLSDDAILSSSTSIRVGGEWVMVCWLWGWVLNLDIKEGNSIRERANKWILKKDLRI